MKSLCPTESSFIKCKFNIYNPLTQRNGFLFLKWLRKKYIKNNKEIRIYKNEENENVPENIMIFKIAKIKNLSSGKYYIKYALEVAGNIMR